MDGAHGKIDTRAEFHAVLLEAIRDGKALLDTRPSDDTIETIVRQLEAVANWSENGRKPSKDERDSIDIGARASRELRSDEEAFAWTRSLHALSAYIERWPSKDLPDDD
jgi:hypothetical protein